MRKNCYHNNKKHCPYFSLYYSFIESKDQQSLRPYIHIVASKKGVHQKAVKRNLAKRRLRSTLRQFLKSHELPQNLMLKIIAKRSILDCPFEDLNFLFNKNLKAVNL